MYIIWNSEIAGLDMKATGKRISRLINESGMNDKQLGRIMHLSVQSINKWRHGINLPDIENIYILSRVIGKRIEDFLVPTATKQFKTEFETETVQDPEAALCRLNKYAIHLMAI